MNTYKYIKHIYIYIYIYICIHTYIYCCAARLAATSRRCCHACRSGAAEPDPSRANY